jgi:hypothetical protein
MVVPCGVVIIDMLSAMYHLDSFQIHGRAIFEYQVQSRQAISG